MEFRLRDFAYPLAIWRERRQLAVYERLGAPELRALQARRLHALLRHARASVPYYATRLADAGLDAATPADAVEVLKALPLLTKDEVRAAGSALHARDRDRYAPRLSQTSGSTGTALSFLLDKPTNVLEFATLWRQFNWAGYRFGERFADLRGHLVQARSGIERDRRLNALNLSAFELTRARARSYVAALRRFRPVMVRGYPSSIGCFARWVLEDGLSLPAPRAVVTSSETLLDTQREDIERAFRAPVYDYYGQMERVAFAGQCAAGRYHVAPEYGLVEILDAAGREAPPGVLGRIVATGLCQRAMPLLRYETRDLAVAGDPLDPCPCGRAAPTLARIHGRLEDLVLTPDGRWVGRLDAAFKYSPGIRLAQIEQERPESIRVRVVPGDGYGAADEGRLREELRKRLGPAIGIEIERVAELKLGATGKLKFVVSRLEAARLRAPAALGGEADEPRKLQPPRG